MRYGGRKRKTGRAVWVCPSLSPECGEKGLHNQGCSLHDRCYTREHLDDPNEVRVAVYNEGDPDCDIPPDYVIRRGGVDFGFVNRELAIEGIKQSLQWCIDNCNVYFGFLDEAE